jgi:hypothetical protein
MEKGNNERVHTRTVTCQRVDDELPGVEQKSEHSRLKGSGKRMVCPFYGHGSRQTTSRRNHL